MKAAVLGGTGFIGSWIVKELVSPNVEVIAAGMPSAGEMLKDHVQVAHCRDAHGLDSLTLHSRP